MVKVIIIMATTITIMVIIICLAVVISIGITTIPVWLGSARCLDLTCLSHMKQ